MFECDVCEECFDSRYWFHDHVNEYDHFISCDSCGKNFYTQQSCDQHMDAVGHWPFECDTCTRAFGCEEDRDEHMDRVGHWKYYCQECERKFNSQNGLNMHLKSSIHQGKNVICPFCSVGFVTASGVSHHLERGSCPKARNLNRETIYRAIRSRDPHGVIVKKELEWHDCTPNDWTPNNAWNGGSYECYLCNREFNSMQGLHQHVSSPVHQQKIYHCPSRSCGREFAALAALFNHLESESCGYIKFNSVGRNANRFLTGNRLIAF